MQINYIEKTPIATEFNMLTESVDIMVIPEYQGKKIGTGIMNKLIEKINEYKKMNPEIRTYLGASKGKESFYEKFGFVSRPNEELGAGMILYDDQKY